MQNLHWTQFPKILRKFISMLKTHINELKLIFMNLKLVIFAMHKLSEVSGNLYWRHKIFVFPSTQQYLVEFLKLH